MYTVLSKTNNSLKMADGMINASAYIHNKLSEVKNECRRYIKDCQRQGSKVY